MHGPIPDSYWTVDGLLLAGEYPGALSDAEARTKLGKLLDAGIRAFFDLTEERELSPYAGVLSELANDRGVAVAYDRVPIPDLGLPSVRDLDALLMRIAINVDGRIPSYVHCWGGIGRTGTVIGCWLVEHKAMNGSDALKRIAELRRGTPDGRRRSPETDKQCAMVRDWAKASRELLAQRLDGLLGLLPAFREPSFSFGSCTSSEETDGVKTLPAFVFSKTGEAFHAAVYEHGWCVPFDWSEWMSEAQRFVQDESLVAAATVVDLTRLLTTHVRQDRFCDGHLAEMAACGHLRAILERMAVIRESLGSGQRPIDHH